MLVELGVADLGVIESVRLVPGGGLTAITGETGAGKTLLVGALGLLLGDRADPSMVRAGAEEAWVEARFEIDGDEVVVARAVPADGRSRAYLNGRAATVAEVAEATTRALELHGQDQHQSLRTAGAQRAALDRFGAIDTGPRRAAAQRLSELEEALSGLGGDDRTRAREIALLRHEIDEIDAATITDPTEREELAQQEEALSRAEESQAEAEAAWTELTDEAGVADRLAAISARLGQLPQPLPALAGRLDSLRAEVADVGTELRAASERFEPDPERLAEVQARRRLLHDLCRRYGDTLAEVLEHAEQARRQLHDLESHDERAAALQQEIAEARRQLEEEEARVLAGRQAAAPELSAKVAARLSGLALPRARLECVVDGPAGDRVELLMSVNPGEPPRPLAKVASGGELSRTMLALRLVLAGGPATLVFDEVDAGVGGEAGLAVGRALSEVAAAGHQVLVITHLPQVAAQADHQVVVTKSVTGGRTATQLAAVTGDDRVAELARMLDGRADSEAGRQHAAELLGAAAGG